MKHLWAPWRIDYILGEKPDGCIFCVSDDTSQDEEKYIVYRGEKSYVILNIFPYNCGHLMIVPYRHLHTLEGMTGEELFEIMYLTQQSVDILGRVLKNPHGFNVGINIGEAAGAGVEEHVHVHIIPRWNGDNSFMGIIGETRVIPEGLRGTYQKLAPEFKKLGTQKRGD